MSDLQVGDLVFSPGGQDVGIYLGDGDVIGASAGTYQVGVRSVAAGSTATRVTLPAPGRPNAALPLDARAGHCGAVPPAARHGRPVVGRLEQRPDPRRGAVPARACTATRCAATPRRPTPLMSEAYEAAFGSGLCITDSYRSYASQVVGVRPQAGAGRGARHLEPRVGPGGRPVRRHQRRRQPAVDLDVGERRPRFGFVQPDMGGAGRREARAVALGVRLHLLSPAFGTESCGSAPSFRYRKLEGGQIQGRSARRRQGSVTLASVVSPASRAAIARPGAGDRAVRRDHHVHVVDGQPGRRRRGEHALGGDQRGGGEHRHDRGATTAPPGPRRAGPAARRGHGRWPRSGCGAPRRASAVRRTASRAAPGRRGGRRPASRRPSAAASAQSSTAIPAVGGRGVGHRAVRDPRGQRGGDRRRASGATPARGHVVGQVGQVHAERALVLLERPRPSRRPTAGRRPAGRRVVARHGQEGLGHLAQVGDVDPGRAAAAASRPADPPNRTSVS